MACHCRIGRVPGLGDPVQRIVNNNEPGDEETAIMPIVKAYLLAGLIVATLLGLAVAYSYVYND